MDMTATTLEEWKAGVRTSSHIRKHESATFKEVTDSCGTKVIAGIDYAPNVFLGCYFISDVTDRLGRNNTGKGWWHE